MRYITLFSCLSLLLLSSCFREYFSHIERQATIINSSSHTGTLDVDFFSLPDEKVLRKTIDDINNAKERIWIDTYTWTEKGTKEAVIRAKKRGIEVKVILEGNVYRTPRINDETAQDLENAGIEYIFSDERRYTFNHIKFWIIDTRWCLSTGNWSYTSFTKNREFIACGDDSFILSNLEDIFTSDFAKKKLIFSGGLDTRIGLSPINTRPWIEGELQDAKNTILIYNQSVTDKEIIQFLEEKALQGIHIEVCQSYQKGESEELSHERKHSPIIWKFSKNPYLHAKIFLIDSDGVIIGSTNMTQNAIENNREILLSLGSQKHIFREISDFYHKDCIPLEKKEI